MRKTLTEARPRRRLFRTKLLTPASSFLLLTACATGKVSNLAMAPVQTVTPTPSALVVHVDLAPDLRADPPARKAVDDLRARLVKRYGEAGVAVAPGATGPIAPSLARLRVQVSRADPGSKFQRLAVGFGMGRSALHTQAALEMPGMAAPSLTFTSLAGSGRRPGMILPGGIAAATGEVSRLAVSGGLSLLVVGRTGLSRDADRSAKLIVAETRRFYRSAGWQWPEA
jgi:hypothetical protein